MRHVKLLASISAVAIICAALTAPAAPPANAALGMPVATDESLPEQQATVRFAAEWGTDRKCQVDVNPSQQTRIVAISIADGTEHISPAARSGHGCLDIHTFQVPQGTYILRLETLGMVIYHDGTLHGTNDLTLAVPRDLNSADYFPFALDIRPWLITPIGEPPTSNPRQSIFSPGKLTVSQQTSDECQVFASTQSYLKSPQGTWESIQWYREGTPIPGANSSLYDLTQNDLGAELSVEFVYSLVGAEPIRTISEPFVSTCQGILAGTPAIYFRNGTLSAAPGYWSPGISLDFSYQWLRDGAPIPGATHMEYQLSAVDSGSRIGVQITGQSRGGISSTVTTEWDDTYYEIAIGAVSIEGIAEPGQTLTAEVDSWSPDHVDLHYVWKRDGQTVGYEKYYEVTTRDVSRTLVATVSASLVFAQSKSASSNAVQVVPLIHGGQVTVTGEVDIWQTLQAYPSTNSWSPLGLSYSYQWLRDGNEITGATRQSYQVQRSDAGQELSVVLTGSYPGSRSVSVTSNQMKVPIAAGEVSVVGSAEVGSLLTAMPGEWAPHDVSLSYQWSRDRQPIAGATSEDYLLQSQDAGSTIEVTVTGNVSGLEERSATAWSKVPILAGKVVISGETQVNGLLTSATTGWAPQGLSLSFQWFRVTPWGSIAIPGATSSSYNSQAEDAGQELFLRVAGRVDGFEEKSSESNRIRVLDVITTGIVRAVGDSAPHSILRAVQADWYPSDLSFHYQWLRNGEEILGANGSEYRVLPKDSSTSISVAVTASKEGYFSETIVSEPRYIHWTWPQADRLSGHDRFATAVEVSKAGFPNPSEVDTVVLAYAYGFADALSAAPLSAKLNAPLLLTEPDYLSDAARKEISRLKPSRVILAGGTGVVGTAIEQELKRNYEVKRLSGSDRYQTSLAIADFGWGQSGSKEAFIATGAAFPDALAAGAAAAGADMPVILVDGSLGSVPSTQTAKMEHYGVETVHIAGGEGAVSWGIERSLKNMQFTVNRYAGPDRFSTSGSIAESFGTLHGGVYLASGANYPDALAGAVVAGKQQAVLLLTEHTCLPWGLQRSLAILKPGELTILGGESIVSQSVALPRYCS